ncbi:MAG: hypothetical protein DMG39_09940 [Acidobacteria bacterium]|nr:MAG: hypothetical protein DMG39_09940 [Acidobacteriota bacterium]
MILFYIFVLMAPMPNHPLFEESFAGLTVIKWLGIICCIYAFLTLSTGLRWPAFLKSWQARFFLVLFSIATLSFFTLSKTEGLTFSPMFTYVSYVLAFFTTMSVVNSYKRLHRALLAAIAGAALASLYVIREFQASGGTNLRPGYVAGDSNYFAICTVLVIPIAVYFAKMNTARLQRWFCGVSLVLMLLGFTLASSRGGLIGLCVAILYMIVFSGRSRRAAILTTVLLLPMMLLSPASPLSRMLHPGYGDFLGAQVRRDFLRAGLDMVRNHPVTGVGLGNFTAQSFTISREVEGKHGVACNTFLEIAAELGIPGFLAYCAILAGALSSAGKLRAEGKRLNDDFLRYAGQGMQAGLLGFSAGAMFLSAEYQKPFWIIVALTAAVPTLLRQQSGGQNSRQSQLVTSRTTIAATNF